MTAARRSGALRGDRFWTCIIIWACVGLPTGALPQTIQPPKPKPFRVELQQLDVSGSYKEARARYVEFPPGFKSPSALHAGEEIVYVFSGDYTLNIQGQAAKEYKAGGSFQILRGIRHSFSTVNGAKIIVFWVVDKGIPLDLNPEN